MRIFASLRIAGRALRRNKMRSLLTMLGIIIGVGAVIGSVSLTSGATKQVEDQVSSLGESVITVFSGNFTQGAMRGGWGSAPTLTVPDAVAIAGLKNVVAVSPEVRDREQVLANGLNWNTQVMGESPDYPQIRNWSMASGAMFGDQDVRSLAKTAVIGKTVADELFPNQNPVGQTVRIRNLPFLIVGVLGAKGFNLFGQDQDDTIVVPYTSHMHRITTRTFVNDILVQAANDKVIDSVQADITDLLLTRHRSKEQDFTVRNQLELMQAVTATSRAMSFLLAGVAAVSLVVGGIGIMNIMLVSVTERTREIGIRMAVGARAADILVQFLIEAVTLSAIGGSIGIALGMGFSGCRLLQTLADHHTRVRGLPSPSFPAPSSASSPAFIPRGKRPSSTRLTPCAIRITRVKALKSFPRTRRRFFKNAATPRRSNRRRNYCAPAKSSRCRRKPFMASPQMRWMKSRRQNFPDQRPAGEQSHHRPRRRK
jgi:putative ABC transport system permease protein